MFTIVYNFYWNEINKFLCSSILVIIFFISDKRKVIFTKEQMENWKPMSDELFNSIAETIATAKR
jgi:hypothetical protein